MSIKKKYLASKPVCKVSFKLESEEAKQSEKAFIVGDFNDWSESAEPMKKLKNGSFSATLDLETNSEYQFRYLLDNEIWVNEEDADKKVASGIGNSENSVIVLNGK